MGDSKCLSSERELLGRKEFVLVGAGSCPFWRGPLFQKGFDVKENNKMYML